MRLMSWISAVSIFAIVQIGISQSASPPRVPGRFKLQVASSVDKSIQPFYLVIPPKFDSTGPARALVVSLHTWSNDLEERQEQWEAEAAKRDWFYLFPNFRGRNDHPEACGSALAQQDILDALAWVRAHYRVDEQRIYLGGISGGGHMTMLMVARHPEPWAAASAWVGISDLAAWYSIHATDHYGAMMRKCLGGAPQESVAIDQEYRNRSPLPFLAGAARVPLDLAAGRHDGHKGSVPILHSLRAFNVLAAATRSEPISYEEITQMSRPDGHLDKPRQSDKVVDSDFNRVIYLRRMAGPSRITIFEGGHEGIASAAFTWFEQHVKR